MRGAGILPVAIYKNSYYFLFSREALYPKHKSSGQWSDFGGSGEKGETVFQTAIREGQEESSGIFGTQKQLQKLVQTNFITKINIQHYTTYLFLIDLDTTLPLQIESAYQHALQNNPRAVEEENGLHEKDMAVWIHQKDLIKFKKYVRPWYKTVLNKIIQIYN